MPIDDTLAAEDYCYVTTTGRVTGNPHTIEIWFALHGDSIYILAGGRLTSDWVKNAKKQPNVTVRIADRMLDGVARIVEPDHPEDALARRMLLDKYAGQDSDLDEWGRTALPVAIDLMPRTPT
jgi:deazaflavin-dependent oxidoreductase (nitroreductase family)